MGKCVTKVSSFFLSPTPSFLSAQLPASLPATHTHSYRTMCGMVICTSLPQNTMQCQVLVKISKVAFFFFILDLHLILCSLS